MALRIAIDMLLHPEVVGRTQPGVSTPETDRPRQRALKGRQIERYKQPKRMGLARSRTPSTSGLTFSLGDCSPKVETPEALTCCS